MYLPAHFEENDPAEIAALIAAEPLAAIVANTEEGLIANHIPLLADGPERLIGHVARNNRMHELIGPETEVLAIFKADDAYVSPNWYPSKTEHHRHVPTWNYQVVHVHGHLVFHHDDKHKRAVVGRLTKMFETRTNGDKAWRMADAPLDYMAAMIDNIVSFDLEVTRIVAKTKASQNREPRDFDQVVDRLSKGGHASLSRRMTTIRETRND